MSQARESGTFIDGEDEVQVEGSEGLTGDDEAEEKEKSKMGYRVLRGSNNLYSWWAGATALLVY